MHLHAGDPATLDRLRDLVAAFATRHPGLLVEHKGVSLAVHYRAVPELAGLVHRSIRHVVTEVDGWTAEGGKKLVEVRPGGPDKGRAIAQFLGEAAVRGAAAGVRRRRPRRRGRRPSPRAGVRGATISRLWSA